MFRVRITEIVFFVLLRLRLQRSEIVRRVSIDLLFLYESRGLRGRAWELMYDLFMALNDESLIFQFGYVQLGLGLTVQARKTLGELLNRALLRGLIDSKVISNLIEALNRSGEYQESIALFETILRSIEVSGASGILHYNAGNAYMECERFQDAIACYEKALRGSDANRLRVFHNLGNCYYELHKDKAAIDYYREALKLASTSSEIATEEYALGNACLGLDCMKDAESHYRRAASRGHKKVRQQVARIVEM